MQIVSFLREQGMNPKQECHDLDPDLELHAWDSILECQLELG